MGVMATLALAKKVGQQVIPSHTVVGKAIGSKFTGKGVDFKALAPAGSKASTLLNKIENTAQIAGNIFNPVPNANSLQANTTGSVNSLLTTTNSMNRIDSSYVNEVNAKQAQGAVSEVTVPKGALDGKLIPFSSSSGGTKNIVNYLPYIVVGFVVLKYLKIV
jgi:hypothetical protein